MSWWVFCLDVCGVAPARRAAMNAGLLQLTFTSISPFQLGEFANSIFKVLSWVFCARASLDNSASEASWSVLPYPFDCAQVQFL